MKYKHRTNGGASPQDILKRFGLTRVQVEATTKITNFEANMAVPSEEAKAALSHRDAIFSTSGRTIGGRQSALDAL
jgi:hypothetical protein